MKKFIIAMIFILMALGTQAFAYTDVEPGSELEMAVNALSEEGVLSGYPDGSFKPEKDITRAEMCKMVNSLFQFSDVGHNEFTDVPYDAWYYMQVLIANEYEYITGFEDGTFRGGAHITREQACAIICRITPLLDIEDAVSITDDISGWARDSVQMIANHKLLKTEADGRFRAKENLKRGELALLLYRFIPEGKTDSLEEGYQGTQAEIAIVNAVILAQLKAAVRDIESIEFQGKEQEVVNLALVGLNGTIEAGLTGNLINKHYVVRHFENEIIRSREIYGNMTEEEKAYFHGNLVKLNTSTFLFLQSYFLGDKSPV